MIEYIQKHSEKGSFCSAKVMVTRMENENVATEWETRFSISTFWKVLKKNWILLLAVFLAVTIGVCAWTHVTYKPVYSSTAKFYVSNVADTTFLYSNGQTSGAKEMVSNCVGFLRGTVVLDQVMEQLGVEPTPENRLVLNSMISVSTDADTANFAVTVSGYDPEFLLRTVQAIEAVLPVACDTFNNQGSLQGGGTDTDVDADASDSVDSNVIVSGGSNSDQNEPASQSGESLMLKVISRGEIDITPNNRSSLIKKPLFAGVGVSALLYAVLLVICLLDKMIYTREDVLEKLPVTKPIFGVIPHWNSESVSVRKLRGKKRMKRQTMTELLISRPDTPFDVKESFHQLCTNVTFCSTGEKGCTVGVLSAYAMSGKSFVMSNLAILLSRRIDTKVLLIDADMRRPTVHKEFQLKNKIGLSDVLAGQVKDPHAIFHTVENLHILTAGTLPPNPIELLSGPNLKKWLAEWKQEYDYILFDLPPLGEVADSIAISDQISGYLFVLRSGMTDSRAVCECCETVAARQTKLYGYVLTDVLRSHLPRAYGYYKSYSYQEDVYKAKKSS